MQMSLSSAFCNLIHFKIKILNLQLNFYNALYHGQWKLDKLRCNWENLSWTNLQSTVQCQMEIGQQRMEIVQWRMQIGQWTI